MQQALFPSGSVGKESACNARDPSSIPGSGRSTGEGIGYQEAQAFLRFPCGSAGKESACTAGDLGSILGLGSSTGEGKSYLFQYSGMENSMVCSPWGHKESDATEQLSLSLSFGWGQ